MLNHRILKSHSVVFVILLLIVSTSCGKKSEDATPNLLLGHWQADAGTVTITDLNGEIISVTSEPGLNTLDITATTFLTSFSSFVGTYKGSFKYKRRGEAVTLIDVNTGTSTEIFVRSLTATSFTYEVASVPSLGGDRRMIRFYFYR